MRSIIVCLAGIALGGHSIASAQSLTCPEVSNDTLFTGATLSTECSTSVTTGCTSKSGVTYDTANNRLRLPGSAGNFQPPSTQNSIPQNVYFATPADFDRDGWDDFLAANDKDQIYMMRNQTITCGQSGCSGSLTTAPSAQTISASWWDTLTNQRNAAFVPMSAAPSAESGTQCSNNTDDDGDGYVNDGCPANGTAESGAQCLNNTSDEGGDTLVNDGCPPQGALVPLKAGVSGNFMTPMAAGDFDGDGWVDVAAISATYRPDGVITWPTAARLYLNTRNCRLKATPSTPCGIGSLCSNQDSNGACNSTTANLLENGFVNAETDLSCATTRSCRSYFPTFATYDLRTGAAVTAQSPTTASTTVPPVPVTYYPGDFGPIRHPVQNMAVLDWDGDGDLDLLYGNSTGACPGTGANALCQTAGRQFYSGISVWLNDCEDSAQWNATTKSCVGHIPRFSRTFPSSGCNGSSCSDPAILIPSTAHNNSTLVPSFTLGFDRNFEPKANNTEAVGFAYVDIDKDNDYDLVVGSPGCCATYANAGYRLRVYNGLSNSKTVHNLDTANPIILSTRSPASTAVHPTYPGFEGSLTGVFVHDFSGDGWADIVTGSDAIGYSALIGGRTRYWKHSGDAANPYGTNWPSCSPSPVDCTNCSSTCNPAPTAKLSESCGSSGCSQPTAVPVPKYGDFDMGFMLDYDHDPQRTMDMVLTNGNQANEAYIFPNRASAAQYAACGSVASGTLPIPSSELTVSGACITPTASVPANTSISYFLSNEDPANYQLACKQTSSGFNKACCVTFSKITGRTITWKAVFDSNDADDGTSNSCSLQGSATPTITSVAGNYTFSEASQHYRAGVVVFDGVSYVGSFTQPGDRGHLYALAAGDGSKYYDVATKLDAQSTRIIYTTKEVGSPLTPISFAPASPSSDLIARVGAGGAPEATDVITWVLSARFGLAVSGFVKSKLGAIMSSTPAVLGPPFRPNWYSYLDALDKTRYDAFSTANANRLPLVLFGSMDGMLHAIISKAVNIGDSKNGTEAWAFVPPYVAASMTSDYNSTKANTKGELSVTSYVDGSPTLFDFKKSDNSVATAAIVSDGAGGSSVTALDVTDTIDENTYAVSGPTPLWSHIPGDSAAGKAMTKPGVARVKLAGVETYVVVAGTGIHNTDSTKGRIVSGYNLESGALLWKFEAECAVTSDITVFETDDLGEVGSPTLDGFADRVVFADTCGYVYKINPAQSLSGGYIDNTGYGTIALGASNGANRYALFSTSQAGALGAGEQRPIVGTIGARADSTTDLVLFFGTGGLESFDITKPNEFYAVYAKNGTIRSKLTGTCASGRCQKFYGGVVVTSDTVILQRSTDALIGGVGSCDFGSSSVQGVGLTSFNQVFNIDTVDGQALHASTGPLYGDAGALYFATISGEIKRIGQPRAATAGADSTNSTLHQMGGGSMSATAPFSLVGWRVVL